MKKYIYIILCGFCILLAGCQPGSQVIMPGSTKRIVIEDKSLSSQILSCVAETETMPSKKLYEQFIRANESFQINESDVNRFQLICLSLASSNSPATLTLGISLLNEYLSSNDSAGTDLRGLYLVLKSVEQKLQEQEFKLESAETRTNELESQLEKLKNIEKILNERSN